jgi:hypothetical protein
MGDSCGAICGGAAGELGPPPSPLLRFASLLIPVFQPYRECRNHWTAELVQHVRSRLPASLQTAKSQLEPVRCAETSSSLSFAF